MPRTTDHASAVAHAAEGLLQTLTRLVKEIHVAVGDLPAVKAAGGPAPRAQGERGPGRNNPKLKSALKASWARYTPAQRKARIAKMLAGRGLKPKRK